jgi:hypothetical protein
MPRQTHPVRRNLRGTALGSKHAVCRMTHACLVKKPLPMTSQNEYCRTPLPNAMHTFTALSCFALSSNWS